MSYIDPMRAETARWQREAESERRSRIRATEHYEALRVQVLRLRAAGGSLAALVADLMSGESDDALRRLANEAMSSWSAAEAEVTESEADNDASPD